MMSKSMLFRHHVSYQGLPLLIQTNKGLEGGTTVQNEFAG